MLQNIKKNARKSIKMLENDRKSIKMQNNLEK